MKFQVYFKTKKMINVDIFNLLETSSREIVIFQIDDEEEQTLSSNETCCNWHFWGKLSLC